MDKDPDEIPIADWIKTRSPMARAKRLVDGGSATGDLLIENAELHAALAAAQSRIEDLLAARANDDAQFAKDRKRIAELTTQLLRVCSYISARDCEFTVDELLAISKDASIDVGDHAE